MTSGLQASYFPVFLICLLVILLSWKVSQGRAEEKKTTSETFTFIQLTDVHCGFQDPLVNPDHNEVFKKVIAGINELRPQPDFIVFTGDLIQGTEDPQERKSRMLAFRDFIDKLSLQNIRFVPGVEDVQGDGGQSFREIFGELYYSFDHKGAHVIALDSASDPAGGLGELQLQWLRDDLQKISHGTPVIIFTHRPLFELHAPWGWKTSDGDKVVELLKPFKHVAVFYGHIHQEHHATVGSLRFHAAPGLMYPFPAPDAAAELAPVPWDPALPWKGLGYCGVTVNPALSELHIVQYPIPGAPDAQAAQPPVTEEQPQTAGEPVEKAPPLQD